VFVVSACEHRVSDRGDGGNIINNALVKSATGLVVMAAAVTANVATKEVL
jgi:hypothetical protein